MLGFFIIDFFLSRYYDTDEEQMVHILVRRVVSASAPNKGAQRLRTFLSILVVPNNTVVCMVPITSGIPNAFKYRGRRLGTVPNTPITTGVISVLTCAFFGFPGPAVGIFQPSRLLS